MWVDKVERAITTPPRCACPHVQTFQGYAVDVLSAIDVAGNALFASGAAELAGLLTQHAVLSGWTDPKDSFQLAAPGGGASSAPALPRAAAGDATAAPLSLGGPALPRPAPQPKATCCLASLCLANNMLGGAQVSSPAGPRFVSQGHGVQALADALGVLQCLTR